MDDPGLLRLFKTIQSFRVFRSRHRRHVVDSDVDPVAVPMLILRCRICCDFCCRTVVRVHEAVLLSVLCFSDAVLDAVSVVQPDAVPMLILMPYRCHAMMPY